MGIVPIVAGLAAIGFVKTPDLLVSADAKLVAIKDEDGSYRLSSNRAARFTAEIWLRRNGQLTSVSFREGGDAPSPGIACDSIGCSFQRDNRTVSIAFSGEALAEDCSRADLLLSVVPVRRSCSHPETVIDRFDVWRNGAHGVWFTPNQFRIESVAESLGDRPWVLERMRTSDRADDSEETDDQADGESAAASESTEPQAAQ